MSADGIPLVSNVLATSSSWAPQALTGGLMSPLQKPCIVSAICGAAPLVFLNPETSFWWNVDRRKAVL
jgi:hypothetical protein